jgi:branched-chain amino acid transport system substrate-binding protein
MSSNSAAVARIGFQLPAVEVKEATGYCAAEMAIEAFNASKAVPFTVELVPVIDYATPDKARAAAQKFADDPAAVGVLGPINSDMAVTTQDIYSAAGLAQVSSEASSPLLTSRGYKNFFRTVANDEVQGRQLARAAVKYFKAKRIAILSDGSAWGRPIAEIFAAEAKKLGVAPVLEFFFTEKETKLNFDDLVDAVMKAKPDLVYFAVYWNKAHIITHRLREEGLTAQFLGSDALKPYAFLEVPSLDKVPPHHTLAGIDMRLKPSARPFFEAFAMRFPMMLVAPQYAAEAYDAAGVLLSGIRAAGAVDRHKVLSSIKSTKSFKGALGDISFDDNGDLIDAEIGLYYCKDGLRHYIAPVATLV